MKNFKLSYFVWLVINHLHKTTKKHVPFKTNKKKLYILIWLLKIIFPDIFGSV